MSIGLDLYAKAELRDTTENHRTFDSAVVMSSAMPSPKQSCAGSPLMLVNERTAIAGLWGRGDAGFACCPASSSGERLPDLLSSRASPTKRKPLRGKVRMRRCCSPSSSRAFRAALMQVLSADSEMF